MTSTGIPQDNTATDQPTGQPPAGGATHVVHNVIVGVKDKIVNAKDAVVDFLAVENLPPPRDTFDFSKPPPEFNSERSPASSSAAESAESSEAIAREMSKRPKDAVADFFAPERLPPPHDTFDFSKPPPSEEFNSERSPTSSTAAASSEAIAREMSKRSQETAQEAFMAVANMGNASNFQ